MFKGITFDLWQTLIFDSEELNQKRKTLRIEKIGEFLRTQGYLISTLDLEQAHEEVWERMRELWAKEEDISIRQQILLYLVCLRKGEINLSSTSLQKLEECYVDPVYYYPPVLVEGAPQILAELKKKYKIGLICNTGRTPGYALRKILKNLGIIHYFEVLTFSNEFQFRKPNRRIFQVTLEKLELEPSETIHVGDDLRCDIWGAKGVGMWSVYLNEKVQDFGEILPDALIGNLSQLIEALNSLK